MRTIPIWLLIVVTFNFYILSVVGDIQLNGTESHFVTSCIEGEVDVEAPGDDDWVGESKIVMGGSEFYGFLKANGKFVICDVPSGTYLVEVMSPYFIFDPVRVDISSKSGKIRAREVNILKVKTVTKSRYPLLFSSGSVAQFFRKRESWSIISSLKNPMVGS